MDTNNPLLAAFAAKAEKPQAHAEGRCVSPPIGCGQPVDGFADALSRREYEISGWCQACQDRVFVEPDEDEGPDPDDTLAQILHDPTPVQHTLDDLPAPFLRDQELALVDFNPIKVTGDYSSSLPQLGVDVGQANLITSLIKNQPLSGEHLHRPLLDIDHPVAIVPQDHTDATELWIEVPATLASVRVLADEFIAAGVSVVGYNGGTLGMTLYVGAPVAVRKTSPGKHHLYVDAVIPWSGYARLLTTLGTLGVLERGYVSASLARGYTALRLPWVTK